ncbi:antitoxin [Arthrobacter alpinus]|nr:antitoxin [Arthrobacter alpinus]
MSIFDDIKGKAEGLINGNEDAIKGGIEKAGDFVDGRPATSSRIRWTESSKPRRTLSMAQASSLTPSPC